MEMNRKPEYLERLLGTPAKLVVLSITRRILAAWQTDAICHLVSDVSPVGRAQY